MTLLSNKNEPKVNPDLELLSLETMSVALKMTKKEIKSYIDKERYSLNDLEKLREMIIK